MRQENNPVVVALKMEIDELKRRLHFFEIREKYEPSDSVFDAYGLALDDLALSRPIGNKITIPIRAEIKAAREGGYAIRVIAKAIEPGGKGIGISYAVTDERLHSASDQAAILGMLHERFIHDLAKFLRD